MNRVLLFACLIALAPIIASAQLSMTPGWHKISYSELSGSENTTPCPPSNFGGYGYNFAQNCPSVFNTWSSAVADTLRDRLVIWGGGHTDYSGNELYALDLNLVGTCTSTNPCLYRLNNPSPPNGSGSSDTDSDGRPSSRHTYQGLTYVPAYAAPAITNAVWSSDIMVSVGGSPAPGGGGLQTTWQLKMSSVAGECAPYTGASSGSNAYNSCGTTSETISQWTSTGSVVGGSGAGENYTTVWDPWNQTVDLIDDQYYLESYNTNSKAWSLTYNNLLVAGYNANSAFDDYDQLIFFMGNYSSSSSFWVTTKSGATYAQNNITFDSSCPSATFPMAYPAIVWDPIDRAFRVLNQSNFSQQYLLYPNTGSSTWFCTTETYGSTQGTDYPPGNNSQLQMISGKWNYFNNLDVFVLCNDPTEDCWYFRPIRPGVNLTNETGSTMTNVPVTVAQQFRDGDIPQCADAYVDGTAVTTTQTDIKNQWADGDLKFAMVSFVVPSIGSGKTVHARFGNQSGCNNTGFMTAANMLSTSGSFPSSSGNWNFDGQIQLTGANNHNLSARTILGAASSGSGCASYSNGDVDGYVSTSGHLCTYWLKGPVVTAVILEDRNSRSYDVSMDGGTGNPLHPRFEAWFYPQTGQVLLGYNLEDDWASTTSTSSARDQAVTNFVLTGGNTSPATEFTNSGSWSLLTRTMVHKAYCINGTNTGTQFDCLGSTMHIDHRTPYLFMTKLVPTYDAYMHMLPASIASENSGLFGNTSSLVLQGCESCVQGSTGIGYYEGSLDATGASAWHGLTPTWDMEYLLTQCDPGNSTAATCGNGSAGDLKSVMLTNADLAGRIPYWYREADSNAGHGETFDNSGTPGNVQTLGRVVSINARTQISLYDVTASVNECNTNYTADYINYGGSGQDIGYWNGNQDTSHWPNIAYMSYLTTGQYAYYEQQVMQSAYAIGDSPGTRACYQATANGALRMGAAGYFDVDDERATNWMWREYDYGALMALDGSPEQAYFKDKLNANIAVYEGLHGLSNDVGGGYATAYSYGQTSRCNGIAYCPATLYSSLGVWNSYSSAYVSNAPLTGAPLTAGAADANFQAGFSGNMIGITYDMGLNSNALLTYAAQRYIRTTQDPSATIYTLSDYVFPTTDDANNWFTSFTAQTNYYNALPTHWPGVGGGTCEGGDEPYDLEELAALAWDVTYGLTYSTYTAQGGYALMRSGLSSCWTDTTEGYGFPFDPKWDIIPRVYNQVPASGTPQASTPTFNPNGGAVASGSTTTLSTSLGTIICWNTTGAPATNGLGTSCTTGTLINSSSGNVTITTPETLYAVAGESGYIDSAVGTSNPFTIAQSSVGASVSSGVKLSGASIH